MDFYFAASGVIPILALAVLIETNLHPLSRREPPAWLERLLARSDSHGVERGAYWHVPALGVFVAWGEFICLRTLETGRPAYGGARIVWSVLGVLTVLGLTFAWLASLPEANN